ncbi:hypothetical protein CK203_048138 [Vitis vinifera]|uniref:Serine/threonine-protein phosphatase 7 long form-like n=1 Tax=Vitis vinifera TaxID=29760 RepID=A0A438HJE5_VITVI|nr:hypothetical protein CK203_048138 [Vitis vinifera]
MELEPLDPTVLHRQGTHRSSLTWIGFDFKELYCRRREAIFHHTSVLDGHIILLLQQGECIITLQDIAILLRLLVDGAVVIGSICLDWRCVCYSLLGLTPRDTDIDGQCLHFTWLGKSGNKVHLMFLPLLEDFEVAGRHDVDWTTQHGYYIRRWTFRCGHIARGEMAIGSLGYHDPYMVWYCSITIWFLTRIGSFHELLIYDIASPDDFRIRRLCNTILEAIHEMDCLDAPFSVDATTQLQPRSGDTRWGGAHTRGTRHTFVLRDAPSIDISSSPIEETPITPMEVPSTTPLVPLFASSPQPIDATLVDEKLVHRANDDQRGQKNDRG